MSRIVSAYIECYVVHKSKKHIEYLLLKRSKDKEPYPGIWQIITGRIEKNEKAYEAAYREVIEETSLKISKLYSIPKVTGFYTAYNDRIHLVSLFLAVAENKAVILSGEHSIYKWVDYKEAKRLVHWVTQKEVFDMIETVLNTKSNVNSLVEIEISKKIIQKT
ncbi:MAG: NUDIX hydrolase [Ignavibacteria bacterium]